MVQFMFPLIALVASLSEISVDASVLSRERVSGALVRKEASAEHTSPKKNAGDSASQEMQHDLIFDLGFNNGGDSHNYITQGYRVLAVEANPDLIGSAKKNNFFAHQLAKNTLTLVNAGVAQKDDTASLPFYRYRGQEGVWGTLGSPSWHCQGCPECCEKVDDIPTMSCESLLQQHGVPLYMKIDIEGQDVPCILSISKNRRGHQLPRFISFESLMDEVERHGQQVRVFKQITYEGLKHLRCLGYTKFKLQRQSMYNFRDADFPAQMSGPFGQYAIDSATNSVKWRSYDDFIQNDHECPHGDWCDVHAMRPEQKPQTPSDC
eukprot:TRINITY_DN13669_c0_g2_i1.p1 TRINITY_DN13669_c0_g2~~TRINITY_DN13669_c0_g2_i1.p1  ORF type:complete len:337 (-),score=34.17 TRINITY_DN13669_c0_g2_i1:32-994(-)